MMPWFGLVLRIARRTFLKTIMAGGSAAEMVQSPATQMVMMTAVLRVATLTTIPRRIAVVSRFSALSCRSVGTLSTRTSARPMAQQAGMDDESGMCKTDVGSLWH